MYLAQSNQRSPRAPAAAAELPGSGRLSEPAAEQRALDAVVSESALTSWLARSEGPSTEDGTFAASMLLLIMEAFPCSALVARSDGVVLLANAQAHAELDGGALDLRRCLDSSTAREDATITVYPLPQGLDGFERAFILHNDPVVAAATRIARATKRWGLTPHQTEVLRLLVQGDGNKSIATRRGCSLRTVEVHMTALFKRSRTSSRAELIARFWTFG